MLVDFFKTYTAKHKLNKMGSKTLESGIPIDNEQAIIGAWKVPLLLCAAKKNKKPASLSDFLSVNQFEVVERIGNKPVIVSTLVRGKSKELRNVLRKTAYEPQIAKRYVLRVFIESYLDNS